MTIPAGTHDLTDLAVLYALGALSQHEARSFEEHLAAGCGKCRDELESFEKTVQSMGFGASEVTPPAHVRETLLASVSAESTESSSTKLSVGPDAFFSVLSTEGNWQELGEGVLFKTLSVDRSNGMATSLVRMLPGTSLPVHRHIGVEQFFVLEGDCYVAGQRLGPGDYHRAEEGSIHQSTHTIDGTLFLLIAPERYEILHAR